MKKVPLVLQEVIDRSEDIFEVEDWLTGFGLEWYQNYTFTFKGKTYSFHLIDSGKSDEPQNGNYPEVEDLYEVPGE